MHAFSFILAAISLVSANPLSTRAKTSFSGGDITFYEGGITACGPTIDTNSDKTVAVSFHVFDSFPGAGANSNKNPICKTKVKATINGRTQTLLVQDSCAGCEDEDLDLTQAAWDGFGVPRSVGRLAGLKWEFIGVGGGDSGNDNDSNNNNNSKTKTATKDTPKTATKDATKTASSETASETPIKAVGGAVDSSEGDDNTTADATTTSEAAEATTTTDDSTEDTSTSGDDSSSSDSGDDSSSASSTSGDDSTSDDSSSDSNSTTAVSGTADVSACNDAWTACNAKFKGTAEDVASYSCQTEYVDCVNAALASSSKSKKRSVSLKRHIARSRLESF